MGTRLLSRLPQRSFIYLVSVYVLDPNLPPLAPPMIRFENGVLGIVGNYFGGLFSALSFDFPSHVRSPYLRGDEGYDALAPERWQRCCPPDSRRHLPRIQIRRTPVLVLLSSDHKNATVIFGGFSPAREHRIDGRHLMQRLAGKQDR